MANEDDKERVDRKLSELLEELRVAIPGAEVLFAFLLGVAFTERIHTATTLQRNVYFATLLVAAMSTAMAAWFLWFWSILPLSRRKHSGPDE